MDLISIIVPCYNCAAYLQECIDSIKNQSCDGWECIIVDDGSTDGSEEILDNLVGKDGRFKVIHTENHGISLARNIAIESARGKYIIPFDADDVFCSNAIETFQRYIKDYPDASLYVPMIYKFGLKNGLQSRKWCGYIDLKSRNTPSNTSCFRKSDWERVGGYRPGFAFEDWEFWLRLLYKNDNVINIPEVLMHYRIHEGSSFQTSKPRHDEEFMKIVNAHPEIYGSMKNDKEVLVVIPYLSKAAQGRELEYAVAGWRKHFREKFKIVIVGDYHPVVESGEDIIFIECPRVSWPGKGNYWAHIDHVNKFKKVREYFPDSFGFIYTCDDIYAVNDFTLEDVLQPKIRCREIGGSFLSPNAWVVDNYKTKNKLMSKGLPTMNWVCHLPVYYEWDKLFYIYERYRCASKSYVVEQLYFNTFFADTNPVVVEEDGPTKWQYKMWDKSYTGDELREAIKDKIWVCNSVRGWKDEIDKVLSGYYGL